MAFWEFLIQQEGDRSWLPLESPSVEILEGWYRVVARSNRAGTATEIRVTHYATHETPPVRRVRKRSSQTNPDGLIVIMPFTRLQPGLWELRCTNDLMAEMMGDSWQYVVQLDVVSEAASVSDDWDPNWQDNITAAEGAIDTADLDRPVEPITATDSNFEGAIDASNAEPSEATEPSKPEVDSDSVSAESNAGLESNLDAEFADLDKSADLDVTSKPAETSIQANSRFDLLEVLQQVEQRSEQLVDAAFRDLGELSATDIALNPEADELSSVEVGHALPQLQVILERETFIMQRGESLVLTGRVECPSEQAAEWQPIVSELRVRLYDPQTSKMLMDEVYPIDNRMPPFPFSGTISLPEHYQTYLVLGELIFQGMARSAEPQVLATRSFNVTTDLHELIESIANDFPDVDALPQEALMPEIAEPLPASELNRLNAQASTFQRSPQQPLPPQLRPPNPTRTHASLDLPSFAPASSPKVESSIGIETDAESVNVPNQVDAAAEASVTGLTDNISTSAADLLPEQPGESALAAQPPNETDEQSEPQLHDSEPVSALTNETATPTSVSIPDSANLFAEWDDLGNRVPIWKQRQRRSADLSNAPEDISFRALNLQSRFWTRLQALATNPDLSTTLSAIEGGDASAPAEKLGTSMVKTTDVGARQQQSIGLDAELTAHEIVVDDDFATAIPSQTDVAPLTEPLPGPILPEDEPIPTPRLQLPSGELTAGQPIVITVKMPTLLARVYVKLWLRDRQTRALVGTPRWIIDFVPDGFGNQMARTEVTVPPGCLKVQFEAIAVEIATQRESDKVTMTRPIVPPDLSPLSLDGLEI